MKKDKLKNKKNKHRFAWFLLIVAAVLISATVWSLIAPEQVSLVREFVLSVVEKTQPVVSWIKNYC